MRGVTEDYRNDRTAMTVKDRHTARMDGPHPGPAAMQNRISGDAQTGAGPGPEMEDYLKRLQRSYPGAEIFISELPDAAAIKEYAKSHCGTIQIVFSPEAWKRMETDEEFRKTCEEAIEEARKTLFGKMRKTHKEGKNVLGGGIYLDAEGSACQWVVGQAKQPPRHCQKPCGSGYKPGVTAKQSNGYVTSFRTKDGKIIMIQKKLSYRPAKDLARIAKACNVQGVKSAMSSIHASIYQLRTGSGDKKVAHQLIGQAEQVLAKAKVKVKALNKEQLMEHARKRAELKEQLKKAMMIRKMLEEKRTKRKCREYGQIRDYYPTPQEREAEKREEEYKECVMGLAAPGLQMYQQTGCAVMSAPPGFSLESTGVFVDITL